MKSKVYFGIAIRLIVLFMLGFLGTYLPEMFNRINTNILGDINGYWGVRHFWLFWLMVFLFLLSLINFIVSIVKVVKSNYDTSKWG